MKRRVARPWLWPLVPVYWAVTELKRAMVRWGWLRQRWLASPVVSVGSCSAGGAGKTPVALLLAEALSRRGYGVRILTRGYGRQVRSVERVDVAGDAGRYGDEPMLLSRRTHGEVFVGADRYEAGLLAEREAVGESLVHVLDDGFQHRRLGRDVDVVLLTRKDMEDALLPAGDLRESLGALREADVIVLREEELAWTRGFVERLDCRADIWVVRRALQFDEAVPVRPLVFCGIARPDDFTAMLEGVGCRAAGAIAFADHHAYGEEDLTRLAEDARAAGADGFVTTEKDAVKLTGEMLRRLEVVGPVVVARLEVGLVDEGAAVDGLVARITEQRTRVRGRA